MTRVEVRLGSFSNEAADSAARPTSASPRKLTQVLMRIGRDGPIRPLAPRIRVSLLRRPPGAYGAVVWRQIATGADPGQNGPLLRATSPASWQPCSVERVGVRSMPRRSVEG